MITVDFPHSHYALYDRGALKEGETLVVLGASGGVVPPYPGYLGFGTWTATNSGVGCRPVQQMAVYPPVPSPEYLVNVS